MWQQWQKARNYIHSFQTYPDMSPDLAIRHQVNQTLRQHRRPLSSEAWCEEFGSETPIQHDTLMFIYRSLETYSGIELNRVRPHDRLVEDLQFPLVCWFDWATSFCDDVVAYFDIDISDCFDETRIETLVDLATLLESCIVNKASSGSQHPNA